MKNLILSLIIIMFPAFVVAQGTTGNANRAMISTAAGAGINTLTGQQIRASCAASGGGAAHCNLLATPYFLQAAELLRAFAEASNTKDAADGTNNGLPLPGDGLPSPDGPPPGLGSQCQTLDCILDKLKNKKEGLKKTVKDLPDEVKITFGDPTDVLDELDKLKEQGIDVDLGTGQVTHSNGSTTSLASLSESGGGLDALSPDVVADIKRRMAVGKKILKNAGMRPGSTSGSLGGSNGYPSPSPLSFKRRQRSRFNLSPFGLDEKKPASVKGLQRVVGSGDSIGVAGDNIFEMITRRYTKMNKKKIFLKE